MLNFRQQLKPWILPLAMLIGVVFHNYVGALAFLPPWLIFLMLFITFCRVTPREFSLSAMHWILLLTQIGVGVMAYIVIRPFSPIVAQGAFICFFCPTATAAPVITGMLGGSVPKLVSFSLITNIAVAILAPMLFAVIGSSEVDFMADCITIATRVVPLILLPLIAAFVLMYTAPKIHKAIASKQAVSFYVWAFSLIIVASQAVSFVVKAPASQIPVMIILALVALVACCAQFYVGRRIGARYSETVTAGQALGQKNTVLAIWMALTYLNPICSVAPAAYVAWQNIINSMQLYRKVHT